jgi:hypothetical protein
VAAEADQLCSPAWVLLEFGLELRRRRQLPPEAAPVAEELPTGTVTFLFTDIEGSTRLLQELGDRYAAVRDQHAAIVRWAIAEGGGVEVSTEGDCFFAAFGGPVGAVRAAVAAQRGLAGHDWPAGFPVRVRLLTLTGAGGTGKSRLALQVAAELLPELEHGALFVDLSAVTDPALVPAAVARALRVPEVAGRPVLEAVKDHLRDQELLLVVDNFEQVVAAGPLVEELLTAAPRLKVLVTSRVALGLRGEQEYDVPVLSRAEAVRLFSERAQAVRRSLAQIEEAVAPGRPPGGRPPPPRGRPGVAGRRLRPRGPPGGRPLHGRGGAGGVP